MAVHDKCMDGFSSFVIENSLTFGFPQPGVMTIDGSLHCAGGLVIHVEKTMDIDSRRRVRGRKYRYQAQFAYPPIRQIFRYDNSHSYPGHPDDFHRHAFNIRTWKPVFPPRHIGRQGFPTLSGVIEELREWWLTHHDDPDIFPPSGATAGD